MTGRATGDDLMSAMTPVSLSLMNRSCAEKETVIHATDTTPASIQLLMMLSRSCSSTGTPSNIVLIESSCTSLRKSRYKNNTMSGASSEKNTPALSLRKILRLRSTRLPSARNLVFISHLLRGVCL